MNARCVPPAARRSGFTILEVVLAMGILVLGASAILGMLTFGAALTRTAQLRAAAASATESVLADLERALFPYQDGELGEPVELVDRPVPGAEFVVYSAKARPNPAEPRQYRVDVQMSWSTAGVRRTQDFSLLLLRELPFGERLRRELIEGGALRRPARAPR